MPINQPNNTNGLSHKENEEVQQVGVEEIQNMKGKVKDRVIGVVEKPDLSVKEILVGLSEGKINTLRELSKLTEAWEGDYLTHYLENFHGLDHRKIALTLIKAGKGIYVAHYLEKFKGLDHKEIALKLIEAGQGNYLRTYLKNFHGLDYKKIALTLIEAGQGDYLAKNLEKFQRLDHKEIALTLIEAKQGHYLAGNLEKFQGLDHKEIALKLIEAKQGHYLAYYLEKFHGLDYKKIALTLIEAGQGRYLAKNFEKFHGLDHKEIALTLIEAKQGHYLAHYLEKFHGLDHKEIAFKLIEAEQGHYLAHYLEKFHGLDHKEIAFKLIEAGNSRYVAHYLEKFHGLDHKEIVLKIIEAGNSRYVARDIIEVTEGGSIAKNFEKFHGLDHKETALMLIKAGEGNYLADNIQKFHGLNHKEIALTLIEARKGVSLAKNLEKFQGLDHKEIALKLIEAGVGGSIAYNLEKFHGLDHKEIVLKLIEAEKRGALADNIQKFQGLDHKEFAFMLIKAEEGNYLAKNLEKFQGLDHKEIALMLIKARQSKHLLDNLEKFQGLDHKEIALMLIKAGEGFLLAQNLEKFQGLDREIALILIKAGEGNYLAKNLEKFQGLDHKEIALKLIEAGVGNSIAYNLEKFHGLDHKEFAFMLIKAGEGKHLLDNLEKFQGLDHKEIALMLIKARQSKHLLDNLEKFQGLDHKEIALMLIKAGEGFLLAQNLEKFQGLDQSILDNLFPTGTPSQQLKMISNLPDVGQITNLRLYEMKQNYSHSTFKDHANPILKSQGIAAYRTLKFLSQNSKNFDLDFVVHLAQKSQTQCYSYLSELALPLTETHNINLLDKNEQTLFSQYITDIGLVSPETYLQYKTLNEIPDMTERTEKINILKTTLEGFRTQIIAGEALKQNSLEQEQELYNAVLYTVFPPATGITKNEMVQLNEQREDRQADVTHILGDALPKINKSARIELRTGQLSVQDGEELDMKLWHELSQVIKTVHKKEKDNALTEDLAKVGEELVTWSLQSNAIPRKDMWERMYTHEVLQGKHLPEDPGNSVEELMRYKEFIGDRIKSDYVKEAVAAYRKASPDEYENFSKSLEQRIQIRNPNAIASQIWKMREQYQKSDQENLRKKFADMWDKRYSFSVEEVLMSSSAQEVEELIIERSKKDIHEELPRIVGMKLVRDTNNDMRRELDKFGFQESAEHKSIPLEFVISKHKAHGVAGYNMGVCVTPDETLWETPEFMNVICFDTANKVAMGGMHLYFVKYEGKVYLSLPGINPSLSLLGSAETKEIYTAFINFAKKVAEETDCAGLWIPTNGNIHSNRSQIQTLITGSNYHTKNLSRTVPFSTDPYKYNYDGVFEVPLENRGKGQKLLEKVQEHHI